MERYVNRLIVIEHHIDVPGYEEALRAYNKATRSERLAMVNPDVQGPRMRNPVYQQLLDGTYEPPMGWRVINMAHRLEYVTTLLFEMKVTDTAYRD